MIDQARCRLCRLARAWRGLGAGSACALLNKLPTDIYSYYGKRPIDFRTRLQLALCYRVKRTFEPYWPYQSLCTLYQIQDYGIV